MHWRMSSRRMSSTSSEVVSSSPSKRLGSNGFDSRAVSRYWANQPGAFCTMSDSHHAPVSPSSHCWTATMAFA